MNADTLPEPDPRQGDAGQPASEGTPTVRAMEAHDWLAYRAIRLRALADSPDAFGSSWAHEQAWRDEVWHERAQASASGVAGRGFFALHGELVCGLVWCMLGPDNPRAAHIYSMWVAPDARGRGVGHALLAQCIAWAQQANAREVHLGVTVGDSPALRLYRSHGFTPTGQAEPLRAGSPLMAQPMALRLA